MQDPPPPPSDGMMAPQSSTSDVIQAAVKAAEDPNMDIDDHKVLEGMFGLGIDKFENLYRLEKRLRAGSFGTVYETRHVMHPDQQYAVKIIDRARLRPKDDKAVFTEVAILKELSDVENITKLIDFFVAPDKLYMVQMLAKGGDVFDRLTARSNYTEEDARNLAVTLIKTIELIHARHLVHRDLKPENLLLKEAFNDTGILVADFGFATKCRKGEFLQTRCGTPAFVAPEIVVGKPYQQPVDMWSVGCILYMLICGYPPFQGKDHNDLFRKIRAADFTFHDKYWKRVSLPAKQLLSGLLTVNPQKRITASQANQHEWVTTPPEDDSLRSTDLTDSLREMKKFIARQKLKGAMGAVRWAATASFWAPGKISFSQHKKSRSSSQPTDDSSAMADDIALAAEIATQEVEAEIQKQSFRDRYDLVTKMRKGSFATVWECQHKTSKEKFAVKIIKRTGLSGDDDEAVLNEVTIMQSLSEYGKYVVKLLDFYEEEEYFFLVMELMSGGDVFDQIVKRTSYTEKDARDLVKFLLKAVQCLHQNGVAHRDIKPQNLLLTSKDETSRIKLCDFGFARRVHTPQSIMHRVGTPTYVAPEVLKNIPHDERVDLWSIGVTIYVLLVGYAPFMDDDQLKLFSKIKRGEWSFHEPDWRHISDDAKELIRGLMVVDPVERWTVEDALRSPWILQSDATLSSHDLGSSLSTLQKQRSKLRTVAKTIIWMTKTTSILADAAKSVVNPSIQEGDEQEEDPSEAAGDDPMVVG